MQNFRFYNPVKILFGKGEIQTIPKEVPADAKVLVLYGGGSIKQNGVFDQVSVALQNHSWDAFGGIEPNPRYETCMKVVELIRDKKFDFLLAVGGGSVIDATKFIAAAAVFPQGDPWVIVKEKANITEALPFGSVLTLPATGSEMNAGAVITREGTREKLPFGHPLVYPRFSVLDPSVTATLPKEQAANGVVDAFVHVMEQYLTYDTGNLIQQYFAESILKALILKGPVYYENPADHDAAANIMWAATMALNGLIGAGVPQDWSTHMIGHELTAFHEIDHARTLAIVLPGTWEVMFDQKKQRLITYAENVWGIRYGDEDDKARQAIEKTEHFFRSLGVATRLADYEVPKETIPKIVTRMKERSWKLGESKKVTPARVEEILKSRL
ncbi:MAG: iron-containing alcohol dehydrogenase [Bacteroidota bacterium]